MIRSFTLTPYRLRQAADLFTALVIASVSLALAGLTWRLAGHAGTGAITVPVVKRSAAAIDVAPALAFAPFGKANSAEQATATTLGVVLKGIVFAQPASLSVAFIANGGEPAKPFKVGDALAGATIDAIQPQRVLVRNGGRVEFIAFPDPFAPAASATPVPGAAVSTTPPPPTPNAPPPPQPSANAAAQLISRLNATPTSGGYRIGDSPPPGLQAGDVVQSLNGAPLTSPDAARDAFSRAQSAGTAQIQVTRGGKPVTLTIPIR